MIVDDVGIYFDLNQSSRLEQLIISRANNNAATSSDCSLFKERAQRLMTRICDEKLSKYNAVTDCPSLNELINQKNVLYLNTCHL